MENNREKFMFNKLFFVGIRVVLGIIFFIAGVDKIHHTEAFAQVVYNYQILPDGLINLTAIVLPWLELLLGLLLLLGWWLPGTTLLSNLLLVVFFGILTFNMARGLDIHCGCFNSIGEENPHMLWYLIRDSAFLLMGACLFVHVFLKRDSNDMDLEMV